MFLQVVLSTGEVENVNDEEVEQKGLDALSSNSPSTRKSVPLLKVTIVSTCIVN